MARPKCPVAFHFIKVVHGLVVTKNAGTFTVRSIDPEITTKFAENIRLDDLVVIKIIGIIKLLFCMASVSDKCFIHLTSQIKSLSTKPYQRARLAMNLYPMLPERAMLLTVSGDSPADSVAKDAEIGNPTTSLAKDAEISKPNCFPC